MPPPLSLGVFVSAIKIKFFTSQEIHQSVFGCKADSRPTLVVTIKRT